MKKALSLSLLLALLLNCFFETIVLAADTLNEDFCPKTSDGMHVASGFLGASKVDDCTQPRYYTTTCKACKKIFWAEFDSTNVLEPSYHHNDGERIESTDCEKGVTKYTACKNCVLHISEEEIGPSEHNWKTISYESDNCTDGVMVYKKCIVCNKEATEHLGAQEHSLAVVEAEDNIYPTCTQDGKLHYRCDICGYEVFQTAPASHTWTEWTTDLQETCTDAGTKHRTCEKCDMTETEIIEATGHLFRFVDGFLFWSDCEYCGISRDKCTHVYTENYFYEPTCINNGYDCIRCKGCETIITKTKIYEALGHDFIQNNCSRCGLKEYKYISFEDDEDVYISKYNGNNTNIKIPSMIDGYPVIGIEWHAFENNKNITSVSIPQNIRSISVGAFDNCSNLKSIALVDGLKTIGEMAFRHCVNLTSITIPDSVTHIGNYAFGGCLNLTSINVEENNPDYCSVDGVLFNKDKTILIQYPANKNSKSYVIPDSVTSIADYAFEGCTNLTSVIIPDSVTSIGIYAFSGCVNLASIIIPDSVTNIGYDAFCKCTSLTSITIPDSVTKIGVYAFSDCSKLTSIYVDKDNPNYCSVDGVLFNKDKTILIQYPANKNSKSYVIPDSVTSIADYAFEGSANIISVIIPDGATRIDNYAFKGCTNLTSVIIPKSMLSIGDFSFENCYNLQTIYYTGNEKMWNNLSVNDEFNKNLLSANIVYNYNQTLATPKVSSTNSLNGIQLNWNKILGAVKYNIYRRNAGQTNFTYIGTTTGNTFIDKNVKSGQYYCYTVRAFNSIGSYSAYIKANTSTRKYMATPKLTTIYNHQNGLAIKWNAVAGVTKGYRVYRRGAGRTTWTYLGTTKNLYFIDSQVKNRNGEYFRYTVIADGGYHSKFDTTGLYLRRLANPTLNSAVSSTSGITVKWGKVAGSSGYYVYRKTANSTWTRIATVKGVNSASYLDKTAKKGATYTYTVRAYYGGTRSSYYSGISCKDKF